jgi:hypothetical protein
MKVYKDVVKGTDAKWKLGIYAVSVSFDLVFGLLDFSISNIRIYILLGEQQSWAQELWEGVKWLDVSLKPVCTGMRYL